MRAPKIIFVSLFAVIGAIALMAQTPVPDLTPIKAPSPILTSSPVSASPKEDLDLDAAIQSLQQMKAQNDELLKKQAATLDTLDLIQKDADQMRIFSKRG